jgi:hypothetical protein
VKTNSKSVPDFTDVFLFDHKLLKAGDVVLERGKGLGAAITAGATGGRYSHALMWVDGGDFIEAMPTGVRILQYIRVPIINRNNWMLLRLKAGWEAQGKAAADYARNHSFKKYDLKGALRSPLMPRKSMSANAVFCSQLIADAFAGVGVELVPGRSASSVTPNDLWRSPVLEKLQPPFVPAPDFALRYFEEHGLDRSSLYELALMAKERDLMMLLFKLVESEFDGIEWPLSNAPGSLGELQDVLSFVGGPKADRIADILLEGMEENGYFRLLEPSLNDAISNRLVAGQTELIPGYRNSVQRHWNNSRACKAAHHRHPHRLWQELHEMYVRNAIGFQALIEIASEPAP